MWEFFFIQLREDKLTGELLLGFKLDIILYSNDVVINIFH